MIYSLQSASRQFICSWKDEKQEKNEESVCAGCLKVADRSYRRQESGIEAWPAADLLLVGEGLHGAQQLGDGGGEQAEGRGLGQVLGGQLEHAGGGYHLDVEGGAVALHHLQHQLQDII